MTESEITIELDSQPVPSHTLYLSDYPISFLFWPVVVISCGVLFLVWYMQPPVTIVSKNAHYIMFFAFSSLVDPSAYSVRVWLSAFDGSTAFTNMTMAWTITHYNSLPQRHKLRDAVKITKNVLLLYSGTGEYTKECRFDMNFGQAVNVTRDLDKLTVEAIPPKYVTFVAVVRGCFSFVFGCLIVLLFCKPSCTCPRAALQWFCFLLMVVGLLYNNVFYGYSFVDHLGELFRTECAIVHLVWSYSLFFCCAVFDSVVGAFPWISALSGLVFTGFAVAKVEEEMAGRLVDTIVIAEMGVAGFLLIISVWRSAVKCHRDLKPRLNMYRVVVGVYLLMSVLETFLSPEDTKWRISIYAFLTQNVFLVLMGFMHLRASNYGANVTSTEL
jgi:hypothetical protein